MKKILCSGLMVTTLLSTVSAMADPEPQAVVPNSALTTKGYVDAGLREVYGAATSAQSTADGVVSRVTALETTVGNSTSGLVKDVADLQNTVQNLPNGTTYTAGDGIYINNGTISIKDLDDTKAVGNTDKMYVFQNGELIEIPVAGSWVPGTITGNN